VFFIFKQVDLDLKHPLQSKDSNRIKKCFIVQRAPNGFNKIKFWAWGLLIVGRSEHVDDADAGDVEEEDYIL